MRGRVLVILPSRNEAATIRGVTESIDRSLPGPALMILNADSSDDEQTRLAFESAVTRSPKISIRCDYRGKGRQIWEASRLADPTVDTILICDTDTRSSNPEVYKSLREEVATGADLAIANYARYWFDGGFTNNVARPLLLYILGVDIPQPISGDLALSRKGFAAYQHAMANLRHSELSKCASGYGVDSLLIYAVASTGGIIKSVNIEAPRLHAPSFPHFDKIYYDSTPIILAPSCRGKRCATPPPQLTYRLSDRANADGRIRLLIADLKHLLGDTIQDGRPWHEQLLDAVHRARSDNSAIEATTWLWPRYVKRLYEELEIGLTSGVSGSAKTLARELSAIGARMVSESSFQPSSLRDAK